jgi:hypothetical protein
MAQETAAHLGMVVAEVLIVFGGTANNSSSCRRPRGRWGENSTEDDE